MSDKSKIAKIEVSREKCIGAAVCVSIAPDSFSLDSDGKAVVDGGNDSDETLLLAAQSCPTQAISIFDGDGKK